MKSKNSRGAVLFFVHVLQTSLSDLSLDELAAHVKVAPNTFARIRHGEPIQAKTFSALEAAATGLLQQESMWRYWPETAQQDAFKLYRWMDKFFNADPISGDYHRMWLAEKKNTLELLLNYEPAMLLPPSNVRTVDIACYAQQLAWVYTDIAQLYVTDMALVRRNLFERAGACYQLAQEILGEHSHQYLQTKAKFARIGARLAEEPLGKASSSAQLLNWMSQQGLLDIARVLAQERFDFHSQYQALVYLSVMGDKQGCEEVYGALCKSNPGFLSWSYAPDGTMKCILSNKDMHYFRANFKEPGYESLQLTTSTNHGQT